VRTKEDYFEALRRMKPNIYIGGQVVTRDDSRLDSGKAIVGMTFDAQQDPATKDIVIATSHLSNKPINRFTHVHQSPEDLLKKQKMTRLLCRECGGCIQRCMGIDAINALSVITYACDQDKGTDYNKRFIEFLKRFQDNNMVGCCAQSDVKGDRTKRPHEQADPDLYLRIVKRSK